MYLTFLLKLKFELFRQNKLSGRNFGNSVDIDVANITAVHLCYRKQIINYINYINNLFSMYNTNILILIIIILTENSSVFFQFHCRRGKN